MFIVISQKASCFSVVIHKQNEEDPKTLIKGFMEYIL